VNDEGVPNDDMPNFLRPAAQDGLPFSDAALAALLAGTEPPEPMPGLQPVADVLAALRSGPTGDELVGEASVLAEFRRGAGVANTLAPHRPRRVTSLVGARAAIAAAVAALSLGGLATAAYAGMLPAPVQRLAHDTIGAPAAPSGSPAVTHLARNRTPVRPGATGSTPHRLCTAYAIAKAHGTAAQRAAARHALAGAAGGAGKIAAFCGTAGHPGRSGAHSGGKGASRGNHGKGNNGEGNNGEGGSQGNHSKGNSQGNHSKGNSQGNQGQGGPSGQQNRHYVPHSKGKSSAHGGRNRGKQGAPYASGNGAHKTPHATERSPRARR
jgi:hypothetical protein